MPTGEQHVIAGSRDQGYAMVALLVGLHVMAIMLTVAMPVWRQTVQREREAELIFRGQQYQRAIALYERQHGPGQLPPDIDTLVEGRFLRRQYKDPITGDDFALLRQGLSALQPAGSAPAAAVGGIIGVVSRSEEESIREYEGQKTYNQWLFVHTGSQTPGETPGGAVPADAEVQRERADGQGIGSQVSERQAPRLRR